METLKTDDRGRVKLPGIEPGKIFQFEDEGNGRIVLTAIKKAVEEPFPEGSLKKFFTKENDREMQAIVKDTVIGLPADKKG